MAEPSKTKMGKNTKKEAKIVEPNSEAKVEVDCSAKKPLINIRKKISECSMKETSGKPKTEILPKSAPYNVIRNPSQYLSEPEWITDHLESHTMAELVPMADLATIQIMESNILRQGQLNDIIVFENRIADGRARQVAAERAGLPRRIRRWLGSEDELLYYVYSHALVGRHLTSSQRAVLSLRYLGYERALAKQRQGARNWIESEIATLKINDPMVKGKANEQLAKKFSTNSSYIAKAIFIEKESENLLKYVMDKALTLDEAKMLIKNFVKSEEREEIVKEAIAEGVGVKKLCKQKNQTKKTSTSNVDAQVLEIHIAGNIDEKLVEQLRKFLVKHKYNAESKITVDQREQNESDVNEKLSIAKAS